MRTFRIKSFSRPGTVHVVTQHDNGDFSCDCEFALYKNKICDHVRRARHMRMKSHGTVLLTKKRRLANIKIYNRYCKRYVKAEDKLMNLNISRITAITNGYKELEQLRVKILRIKRKI